MNTASRPCTAPALNNSLGARFAAVALAALMTLGTLGSVHGLSVIDTAAGTLAQGHPSPTRA